MEGKLQVMLIDNAGLLLEYNRTVLLLDSIFGREGPPFIAVPQKM